jgi:plastocyanin
MKSKGLALLALIAVLALTVVLVTGCTGGYTTPSSGGTSGGTTTTTGGTSSGGASGGGVAVSMKNFAFNPSSISAAVGDVVTFTNEDSVDHTVNIDGVEKGTVSPGGTLKWTADKAGTFPLKCSIHPQMTGTITVK